MRYDEKDRINAYDELMEKLEEIGKTIKDIDRISFEITNEEDWLGEYICEVRSVEEIDKLDEVYYDNGFGWQYLCGEVNFKDGTWLEREEYDGSEKWIYVSNSREIKENKMEEKTMKIIKGKKSEAVKGMEKEIKEKAKPVFIEKLELGAGEIYVGNLSEADKFQLLNRRIVMQESLLTQMGYLLSNCTICLQEIAKKNGIEIDKILNFGDEK